MPDLVKIAAVQTGPRLMRNQENLDSILLNIEAAARNGAKLIVFPECALPGYMFNSREEALPFAETIPGPASERLAACCRKHGVHAAVGLLEKDGDKCYNTAVLAGPQGIVGKHRKIHLPLVGVDRFVDPGDIPFTVHKTPLGNIGIHICYDNNFPEGARIMALSGADILAHLSAVPEAGDRAVRNLKYMVITRATENKVHVVSVNRVGVERDTRFVGLSRIIDTHGDVLAEAGDVEGIVYGEVDPAEARIKRSAFRDMEIDIMRDRRPEMYGKLTERTSE